MVATAPRPTAWSSRSPSRSRSANRRSSTTCWPSCTTQASNSPWTTLAPATRPWRSSCGPRSTSSESPSPSVDDMIGSPGRPVIRSASPRRTTAASTAAADRRRQRAGADARRRPGRADQGFQRAGSVPAGQRRVGRGGAWRSTWRSRPNLAGTPVMGDARRVGEHAYTVQAHGFRPGRALPTRSTMTSVQVNGKMRSESTAL